MEILPVTRKEQFLKAAMDSEPLTIDAVTRIETYLSKISGANVTIPDPVTKIEMYLASIAGADVVLPDPVTRVEMYLAKLAGMDVLVPEPITRIEQFLSDWVNQPSGVLKTISGAVVFVSDALARAAEDISVEINPVQDLHGYANPWPAGGGVNKFAIGDAVGILASIGASYGLTTTLDATNETVRITGTPTWSDTEASVSFRIISCKSGGYYGDAPVTHDYTGMVTKPFVVSKSSNISAVSDIYVNADGTLGVGLTKTDNAAVDITIRIAIEVSGSTITAWTPYENICPISGHDSVKMWVKPTYDPTANPTATIQLGQTVYSGTLDVTTGVLTVTHETYIFNGTEANWSRSSTYNGSFYRGTGIAHNNSNGVCSHATFVSSLSNYAYGKFALDGGGYKNINVWVQPANTTVDQFKTWLAGQYANGTPLTVTVELATPITYQLTPTEIEMLEGDNALWADAGDITVTYMADGPADDVEALNILLGNRYVNLGEPDEATDREALEILLGGR